MILIDTSVMVEFILPPYDAAAETRQRAAIELFESIERGDTQAIVPEVVLHECFYVLVKRLKTIDEATFIEIFRSILQFSGWNLDALEKEVYFGALKILQTHPKLEFSDAVIAARAEVHDAELATFDQRLAKAFDGTIWTGT